MAVSDSLDPGSWFAEQIGACEPDLLRTMVKTMAEALMSAEADAMCGAGYGERSEERINRRNGYRERDWDTRAGTVAVALFRDGLIRGLLERSDGGPRRAGVCEATCRS
jgi:putative transposase